MGGLKCLIKQLRLFRAYSYSFYIFIFALLGILIFIVLSIKLSLVKAVEPIGSAEMTSIDIEQAGTGQSVTIDGETLSEIGENTEKDNRSRRTILNNNIVRYNAVFEVSQAGQIALSITFPANNTIDEATISSSQGCLPSQSKLEAVSVDGKKSYTNNKATCVISAATGTTNWQITAYPWGSNNTEIQPNLALNGQEQQLKPDVITVIGKPNYAVLFYANTYNSAFELGYNLVTSPDIALYVPNSATNILGVEPINSYQVTFDMSGVPGNWHYRECGQSQSQFPSGVETNGIVKPSRDEVIKTCSKGEDNSLIMTIRGIVTATKNYSVSTNTKLNGYFYTDDGLNIAVPITALEEPTISTMTVIDIQADANGMVYHPSGVGTNNTNYPDITYTLDNNATGVVRLYGGRNNGWTTNFTGTGSIYTGQSIVGDLMVTSSILDSLASKNLDVCILWDSTNYNIGSFLPKRDTESFLYQFGIVDIEHISDINDCGRVGDDSPNFFNTLEEAIQFTKDKNLKGVNALRIYDQSVENMVEHNYGTLTWTVAKLYDYDQKIPVRLFAKTDEWTNKEMDIEYYSPTITPGLLAHTITAVPSSTNPGKEEHITIITRTYNRDANSLITTTLPAGLLPKENSFTITNKDGAKEVLVPGEGHDYIVSANGDGSSVITFNLHNIDSSHGTNVSGYEPILPSDNPQANPTSGVTNITLDDNGKYIEVISINNTNLPIAADNNGNGIVHANSPIEFDVIVDENAAVPSTFSIESITSGVGTGMAKDSFRTATANVAVTNPPRTFNYDLAASPSNIYAGDSLTYRYSIHNLSSVDVYGFNLVDVLPYNGDSRGTINLTDSYSLDDLSITVNNTTQINPTDLATSINLYYTTNTATVQEIEKLANTNGLISNSDISWNELRLEITSSNDNQLVIAATIPNGIQDQITAIKLVKESICINEEIELNITLTDIGATGSNNNPAKLANDISYLSYQTASAQASSHASRIETNYLGSLLTLSLDKQSLITTIAPGTIQIGNGSDNLTNVIHISTRTRSGYNLTMKASSADGSLVGNKGEIPTLASQPSTSQASWAVKSNLDNTWQAIPGNREDQTPLSIYSNHLSGPDDQRITLVYGIAATNNTIADTYKTNIIYTLTVNP